MNRRNFLSFLGLCAAAVVLPKKAPTVAAQKLLTTQKANDLVRAINQLALMPVAPQSIALFSKADIRAWCDKQGRITISCELPPA